MAPRRAKLLPPIKKSNKRADIVAETAPLKLRQRGRHARMRASRRSLAINDKSTGVYYTLAVQNFVVHIEPASERYNKDLSQRKDVDLEDEIKRKREEMAVLEEEKRR